MEVIARQAYKSGKLTESPYNFSSNCLAPNEFIAKLSDKNYRAMNRFPSRENKFKIGFGPFVAISETIAAFSLVWCFKSIATVINLLTTVAQFGQTWVAGIDPNKNFENNPKINLTESEKRKKVDEAIQRKESGMAWFQLFAGTGGVAGIVYEFLTGKKDETANDEVPLFKKIALSASSALSALFMLAGGAEKTLMSMLSWNGGGKNGKGQDYRSMQIDGASDVRCAAEWGIMSLVPWVSNIGLVRNLVDLAVTYGAFREGADYFKDAGKMNLNVAGKNLINVDLTKNSKLKKVFELFVNPFSLFRSKNNESETDRYRLCYPFNKAVGWLLGAEFDVGGPGAKGFRNKVIVPFLRNAFNYDAFNAYLDKDENIICEYVDRTKPEVSKPTEDNIESPVLNPELKVAVVG